MMAHFSSGCALFGTISLSIHWISSYLSWSAERPDHSQQCNQLISYLVDLSISALSKPLKELNIAGSSLLVSISNTVRPPLLQLDSIKSFLASLHVRAFSDTVTRSNSYRAATFIFVLSRSTGKMTQEV